MHARADLFQTPGPSRPEDVAIATVTRPIQARSSRYSGRPAALVKLLLLGGLLTWLVVQGAGSFGYSWQWQRVPRYLFQVFDGEFYPGTLLKGLRVTLELSGLAFLLTLVLGLAAALLRLSPSPVGRALAVAYVETIRNTPLLVQLYLCYFVLAPLLGIDRFATGVLCLGLFEGAYAAEIYRAGILAVPRGQWEAARSLGLRTRPLLSRVILPQTLPLVLPPLTNLAVALVKHSAIVSVIAIFDLTNEGRNAISDTFMTFEIWLTVAAMYLAVTVALSGVATLLELRLARRTAA